MVKDINNSSLNKRDNAIDIAKGLGILLVVLGHYDIPKSIGTWIFSFHMPLFVFLSGYVWKCSLKSIRPMIKNWMFAGLIGCIVYYIKERDGAYFIRQLVGVFFGSAAPYYRIEINPAIWFLSCLIFIQLLTWYLTKKKWGGWSIVLAILLPLLGMLLSGYKNNSYIPWNIDVACFLFPFFILGHYTGINKLKITTYSNTCWMIILSVLFLGVLVLLKNINGSVNIYRLVYGNSLLLYYINGIMGSFGVLLLSYCISRVNNMKLINILCNIGQHTMIIMCYHQILNIVGLKITRVVQDIAANNFLHIVVKYSFFIAEIILLVVISMFIKKIRLIANSK